MKKIILLTIITISFFSCSTSDDDNKKEIDPSIPVSYNKLKAYNKTTSYYYYSPDPTRNGISRIYLDTINGIITQYTSNKSTNQGETSEQFTIKYSEFYKNYKNTNINYVLYIVDWMKTYEVNFDIKRDKPSIIVLSNDNSDKFIFYRNYDVPKELFISNFQTTEYYKKLEK